MIKRPHRNLQYPGQINQEGLAPNEIFWTSAGPYGPQGWGFGWLSCHNWLAWCPTYRAWYGGLS